MWIGFRLSEQGGATGEQVTEIKQLQQQWIELGDHPNPQTSPMTPE